MKSGRAASSKRGVQNAVNRFLAVMPVGGV
jgi:hypothetical protein